jgi:uncharacterized membrane protein YGL010W
VVLFFGGWVIQFIGHGFEKSKPAFMDGVLQILIAPVFILFELGALCGVNLQGNSRADSTTTSKDDQQDH